MDKRARRKPIEEDLFHGGYGRVSEPFWSDRPVAIVGGGPSLVGFDFELLRGAHVLAVKQCIFDIPWADAGFGIGDRYAEWRDRLAAIPSRIYWAVSDDNNPPQPKNITFLHRLDGVQVSTDPGEIYGGGTSGFGAFQIALHKRARSIVLFGFDYDGEGFKQGDVPNGRRKEQVIWNWKNWAEHFRVFVPALAEVGITVVNACPQSAIRCFPKAGLEDGVRMLHA